MNQAPSYEELKNNENFWIQTTPYTAGINLSVDIDDSGTFLYYDTLVTVVDDYGSFPFKQVRVDVLEIPSIDMNNKYPIGFIKFDINSAIIRLFCENKLFTHMVSSLLAVKDKEIEFFITMPNLPEKLPNVYPIIDYQYRICSTYKDKCSEL
ncbi:hypothetical protein [Sulfurimonas sp.]|uniref:hypothetical protein n=1 Tax=Sulfurimonas sp. TaxID=2022749 RepID=UPI003563D4C9